jgi:hypothetical protein
VAFKVYNCPKEIYAGGSSRKKPKWNTQWAGGLGKEEEGMTKKGCIMIHYT